MFRLMWCVGAWLVAAVLMLGLALPLAAQDSSPPSGVSPDAGQTEPAPDRMAAARDLLQATHTDAQFAAVIPLMFAQLKQAMSPSDPKMQGEFDQIFEEVQKQFIERRDEVLDQIATLYANKFSPDEMKALADFYRSPIGQKFIAAMPELTAEAMRVGNAWGQKIAQDAERKVQDEMRKRGLAL
jgi:uncharacterized protein